jgi:hypothetical protein
MILTRTRIDTDGARRPGRSEGRDAGLQGSEYPNHSPRSPAEVIDALA